MQIPHPIVCLAICLLGTSILANSQSIVSAYTMKPPDTLSPAGKHTWAKLQSIIIDKCNFDRIDLTVLLSYLSQRSKELDPEHEGVRIILRGPYTPPPVPVGHPIHREAGPSFTDVPLGDVLGYLVSQTNCDYKIEDDTVVVFAKPPNPKSP